MGLLKRESKHGAQCPACGSRNTALEVNKTALSWFRVGRNTVNMEIPGLEDTWRCKDCKTIFKVS